jgi:teichuronic acid biosynthesis glycosyltransferase TuaC
VLDEAEGHLQEAGAELAEALDVAGAEEAIVALAVAFAGRAGGTGEGAGGEGVLDLAGEGGAGAHEGDVGAEHALEHGADEGVVGAAEDHGVDLGFEQGPAGGANGGDGELVELLAGLDDGGEGGAGNGMKGDVWVDGGDGALVGGAGDGGGGGEQADATAAGGGDGLEGLGTDDAEDVDREGGLAHAGGEAGKGGGGGGVAGDHEELGVAAQELLGDLAGEGFDLLRGAFAVGEASGVAEIEEVLAGQADEQLVQDGEAADAGVEHGDRSRAGVDCGRGAGHGAIIPQLPGETGTGGCAKKGGPARGRTRTRAGPPKKERRTKHQAEILLTRAAAAREARKTTAQIAYSARGMRVLVVSNMLASAEHPERGRFVRDQVEALRGLKSLRGSEIELYELGQGVGGLARGEKELRSRYGKERFDVVHAHFGLTAWPAMAVKGRVRGLTIHGSDVSHRRTRLLTALALPRMDVVGTVSEQLIGRLPGRRARGRAVVLACGVDLGRFRPLERAWARSQLQLEGDEPFVLFPASPERPEKRYDRAVALAGAAGVELRTLGGVDPELVPLWVNAASVVVVPSEREGFGLAALEGLACDVAVLATPVGIHEQALGGVEGALCAPFELEVWREALQGQLRAQDPRVKGRERAEEFSAERMAERVGEVWRAAVERAG